MTYLLCHYQFGLVRFYCCGCVVENACKTRCNGRYFTIQFQVADLEGKGLFRAVHEMGGRSSGGVALLRGRVVFDKSFVIMALACAAAPIVGAGIYIVVYLF